MIRQGRLYRLVKKNTPLQIAQMMPLMLPSGSESTGLRTRDYSISSRNQNSLIIGGLGILAVGATLQLGMKAYQEYEARKAAAPPTEQQSETNPTEEVSSTNATSDTVDEKTKKEKAEEKKKTTESSSSSIFGNFFTTTFYDGGFEDKMTKREAALILGVRESANVDRIKEAHRRILINNHPDRGGSPFIAAKVNEAKDFLLKGKN